MERNLKVAYEQGSIPQLGRILTTVGPSFPGLCLAELFGTLKCPAAGDIRAKPSKKNQVKLPKEAQHHLARHASI